MGNDQKAPEKAPLAKQPNKPKETELTDTD